MLNKHSIIPDEVARWAAQYKGFLNSMLRADPALEYDDLLNDLYVILLEKNCLSIKVIAGKYRMRKLGFNWVPEQPNSNWSDWERGGEEAAELIIDDGGAASINVPTGLLAASSQIAKKMNVTRRRAQQIRKKQCARLTAQVKGAPDECGQFGLFSDGALHVN